MMTSSLQDPGAGGLASPPFMPGGLASPLVPEGLASPSGASPASWGSGDSHLGAGGAPRESSSRLSELAPLLALASGLWGLSGCAAWLGHHEPRPHQQAVTASLAVLRPGTAGYPDAALPAFFPAERGQVATYVETDPKGRATGAVWTDRVTALEGEDEAAWESAVVDGRGARTPVRWRQRLAADRVLAIADGVEEVRLKTPLRVGTRWSSRAAGGGTLRVAIAAIEEICTPRGTFPACLKLVAETTPRANAPGLEVVRWLAPGYGEVRTTVRVREGATEIHGGQGQRAFALYLRDLSRPASRLPFAPPPCP